MVALTSSSRFDSRDLSILSLIQTSQFSNQTPTGFRANVGHDDYIDFSGSGFLYFNGRPYQGTTTQFTVYTDNKVYYKATGLSITIDEFIQFSHMTPRQFSEEILKGNDVLVGSNKADYLEGYGGNDTYVVKNTGDQVIEKAQGGFDIVKTSADFSLGLNDFVEALVASPGSTKSIDLLGNFIANQIKGNAGINVINGSGGHDVLWGGNGRDTFVFDVHLTPSNRDTIKDFDFGPASDTIELSQKIFHELDLGRLDASAFKTIGSGAAVDGNDRIIYNRDTGALSYDADGHGGVAAKVFAVIDNHARLTFDDFLVVA